MKSGRFMELASYRRVVVREREPEYFPRQSRGRLRMGSSILISILITFLVIILVLYLINMLPIDGRTQQIIRVIVIIIGIISMLKYLAAF
jgi:hypothetical protein